MEVGCLICRAGLDWKLLVCLIFLRFFLPFPVSTAPPSRPTIESLAQACLGYSMLLQMTLNS